MDLQLVFAVEGPTTQGTQVVAALAMTLTLAKGPYERLGSVLAQYEERYGPIALPEMEGASTNDG